jgi:hypothetical protein
MKVTCIAPTSRQEVQSAAPAVSANMDLSATTAEAISKSLKPGEKLTITINNGTIEAQKEGPDRYEIAKRDAKDALASTASALTAGVNASFGTDPTVSTLAALQAAYSTFSTFSLIPNEITSFFANNFFPAFRMAAPILDSIKFINTWRLSKTIAKGSVNQPKGWRSLFKSGNVGNLIVDGAHLLVDLAVVGALVAGMAHFPPLAFIPKLTALGIGFGGDLAAAAFHSVSAAENLSNPENGATFMERLKKFMQTQSWTAIVKRVFKGEEPLTAQLSAQK